MQEPKSAQEPITTTRSARKWTLRHKFTAVAVSSLVALCLLEVAVRLYQPVELIVRGGKLNLPAKQSRVFYNDDISNLDREITYTRNSLGFRGPEPPVNFTRSLTILAIGGSTTAGTYHSDGKTWTALLEEKLASRFADVWVNNAGFDGHSTFGHQVLLDDYVSRIRPKTVLFLIGVNDLGIQQQNDFDGTIKSRGGRWNIFATMYGKLVEYSDAAALFESLCRYKRAKDRGLIHSNIDHRQLRLAEEQWTDLPSEYRDRVLQGHREYCLPGYELRVRRLIASCRENGIEPVLVTQPALFGPAIDDVTGVDLSQVKIKTEDGRLKWDVQELYNDVTRRVGRETDVFVIDLAKKMPKSSRYFYDYYHFTNPGAQRVAEIIDADFAVFVETHFPSYVRRDQTNESDIASRNDL